MHNSNLLTLFFCFVVVAVVIVYDVTEASSFANVSRWLKEFDETTNHADVQKLLIGNKIDLVHDTNFIFLHFHERSKNKQTFD